MTGNRCRGALLLALLAAVPSLRAVAPFTIIVVDPPGVGFNDPTPADPVGGNSGTTIGEQRLIAFQYAASIWSSKLDSPVPIRVRASFGPLECTKPGGTLGIEYETESLYFSGPVSDAIPNVWYVPTLANKLAGTVQLPDKEEMNVMLNSDIGKPNCFADQNWYYGLDSHAAANQVDLVVLLLHEMAHGLGFGMHYRSGNYSRFSGRGDVYDQYLLDTTTGKMWKDMTDEERQVSTTNTRNVVWTGINVRKDAPKVLQRGGAPSFRVTEPKSVAANYHMQTASFGAPVGAPNVNGELVFAVDDVNPAGPSSTDACSTLLNGSEIAGRIAMADRGTCSFVQKARNAQAAGAIGLVLVDNVDEWPIHMTGKDADDISIPVILIRLPNGNALKTAMKGSERVVAELFADPNTLAGADAEGRPIMFTPNPVKDGSTINHWDHGTAPNQLMEWAPEQDLTQSVEPPGDLTLSLLRDLGWFSDFDGVPDGIDECPGSDRGSNIVIDYCDTGVRNVTFANGCRISDYLKPCADEQGNSGTYAACVASVAKKMVDLGAIRPEDPAKIQACVVGVPHP